jgi:3-deoxy-D-manno-octulosonic-acid transferase
MFLLYSFGIWLYGMAIKLAGPFNTKARSWVNGRKNWRQDLKYFRQKNNKPVLWLHAASLGEMEQGLPLLEHLKSNYSEKYALVVSFFSPSGYLNFKQRGLVDAVFYLPLDLKANTRDFVNTLNPSLAVFIKYEIWFNFIQELNRKQVKIMLAPALFRSDQIYFRSWAKSFFLPRLKLIDNILVQNQSSQKLLAAYGIKSTICGDPRFDRAQAVAIENYQNRVLEEFSKASFCLIAGSSWPPEEKILQRALRENARIKLILAPHEVKAANLKSLKKQFDEFGTSFLSELKNSDKSSGRVIIIDSIGLLKKLYRYGDLAFIGGGFGKSVHSTVEPIIYNIPVCFGPHHRKFPEPSAMIAAGAGFELNTAEDLIKLLSTLERPQELQEVKECAQEFAQSKLGASRIINEAVDQLLR